MLGRLWVTGHWGAAQRATPQLTGVLRQFPPASSLSPSMTTTW